LAATAAAAAVAPAILPLLDVGAMWATGTAVAAGTLGTLALDDDGTGASWSPSFSSCVISPEDIQHTVVSESCFPPCPSASFRRPPAVVVFPDEVSLIFASVVVFSTPSPVNVAVVVIVAVVSSPADLATYTAGRGGSMVVQRGL